LYAVGVSNIDALSNKLSAILFYVFNFS